VSFKNHPRHNPEQAVPMVGAAGAVPPLGFGHFFIVWLRRGLAAAWSQLLAIRSLPVPIGVGVGIGIGIDSDGVSCLVLTHGVASLPEYRQHKPTCGPARPHLLSFDSDSDTDPDPDPDYNPYRDRDAFVLFENMSKPQWWAVSALQPVIAIGTQVC
jgi:hypothetical protein